MKHRYTIEQVKIAVEESVSLANVLRLLNIIPAGGNYHTLKKFIQKHTINISHFTGQAWNKGKIIGPKRSVEDYLTNKHFIISFKLKNRLIKEGYFESKCYNCNLIEWLGQPIPIELHHKDGNVENNLLENLTILCPNCHTLTDNYRGKGK